MDLLFTMAHWHGLAKLRLHHNLILDELDRLTKTLGERLRDFNQNTCVHFDMKELRREYNARIRREVKQTERASRQPGTSTVSTTFFVTVPQLEDPSRPTEPMLSEEPLAGNNTNLNIPASSSTTAPRPRNQRRRRKTLNINTYKLHSYGDYARAIRMYGTMDSYSTELVRIIKHMLPSACSIFCFQGELEHRSPKSRFIRTNRKQFVKQLTCIER